MASSTINIADHGDLILLVGKGASPLRIRVTSDILRAASKTFNAMFGSNFAEGQDLSSENPKEIGLEEEDAPMMKLICQVLHFRYGDCPDHIPSSDMLVLAQLIDKYALHHAMGFAVHKWLKVDDVMDEESLTDLLKVALLLDRTEVFKQAARALILETAGSYTAFLVDTPSDRVHRAFSAIKEKRTHCRQELVNLMFDTMNSVNKSQSSCDCAAAYLRDLASELVRSKLEPRDISQRSLASTLKSLDDLPYPVDNTYKDRCSAQGWTYTHRSPLALRKGFKETVQEISDFEDLDMPV